MYGLTDSPVCLAAYMIDHDPTSYGTLIAPAFVDGVEGGLTRDDILDNITHVLADQHGGLDREVVLGVPGVRQLRPTPGDVDTGYPVAVSVFPDELFQARRGAGRRRRTPT